MPTPPAAPLPEAAAPAEDNAAPAPADFESAVAELEDLVARMESGDLSLEHSLQSYRRGVQLLGYCRGRLAEVAQQVKVLEGDMLQEFPVGDGGS